MKGHKNEFVRGKVNHLIIPGEILQSLGELQEFTQKDLADQTGVSRSKISAMENNMSQIGRDGALAWVEVL